MPVEDRHAGQVVGMGLDIPARANREHRKRAAKFAASSRSVGE